LSNVLSTTSIASTFGSEVCNTALYRLSPVLSAVPLTNNERRSSLYRQY